MFYSKREVKPCQITMILILIFHQLAITAQIRQRLRLEKFAKELAQLL